MRWYIAGLGLIAGMPANAAFLHAHVAGNVQYPAGASGKLPDALTIAAGFSDYLASPDLPQIADDLSRYSLVLRGVGGPGDPLLPGARPYVLTGGVWRDGVLVERLLPTPTQLSMDPVSGFADLFLTLRFGGPLAGTPKIDFRAANGFALQGEVAMTGPTQGGFAGKFVTAIAQTPEPGMVALFGLGVLALGRARRRG